LDLLTRCQNERNLSLIYCLDAITIEGLRIIGDVSTTRVTMSRAVLVCYLLQCAYLITEKITESDLVLNLRV